MTDHVNYVGRVDHPILMDEPDQTVMIKGFTGRLAGDVMLFNSFGRHYLDYGITDGSLLLCAMGSSRMTATWSSRGIRASRLSISSGSAPPRLPRAPCACWEMRMRLIT